MINGHNVKKNLNKLMNMFVRKQYVEHIEGAFIRLSCRKYSCEYN